MRDGWSGLVTVVFVSTVFACHHAIRSGLFRGSQSISISWHTKSEHTTVEKHRHGHDFELR